MKGTRVGVHTEPLQPRPRHCLNCGRELGPANHSRKPPVVCKDCSDTNRRWVKWLQSR
jgi:DNA-directed RNA polymerase subunit RPC12/RpoP